MTNSVGPQELAEVKRQLEIIKEDIADLKVRSYLLPVSRLTTVVAVQSRDEELPVDQEEATRRKVRVHGNFEELLADYLSRRVPCIQGRDGVRSVG